MGEATLIRNPTPVDASPRPPQTRWMPDSPEVFAATLVALLAVSPAETRDTFTGSRKSGGVGRVFGGQVIAQALAAAQHTVPGDRPPHSLHGYFLRGGSEDHQIDYTVTRDLDGGSFSNRRVVASQNGVPILSLTASFQRREHGFHHQLPMPDVPGPESLPSEIELRLRHIERMPEHMRAAMLRSPLIEIRPVDGEAWMGRMTEPARMAVWFRPHEQLLDDPAVHRAMVAYASDYSLLLTCSLPYPLSWFDNSLVGASLDHAIWFHESEIKADDWLLYVTDSPWAGHGRGFNRGRIYARDGQLLAEVAQEGVMRQRRPA